MIKARDTVRNLSVYSLPGLSRREKQRMDHNENAWGCSERVLEAVRAVKAEDISVYPSYSSLYRTISGMNKLDVTNILLTNGADEGIRCLLETYIEKGNTVVLTDPTFSMYKLYTAMREGIVRNVPLNGGFAFPTNKFSEQASGSDLAVIVNPSTPVGSSLDREQIIDLLEALPNTVVILDEAYTEYRGKSDIDLVKNYSNLVVLRSFSKAYGLAGLRLGYIAASVEIIDMIRRIASPYNVNSLVLIAAEAALRDDLHFKRVLADTAKEKKYLRESLARLGIKSLASDTNFFAAYLGENCDSLCEEITRNGILIKNLNGEAVMKNWVRITVGTREENHRLLNILKRKGLSSGTEDQNG